MVRVLFLTVILFLSLNSSAVAEENDDLFFIRCVVTDDPILDGIEKEEFCACLDVKTREYAPTTKPTRDNTGIPTLFDLQPYKVKLYTQIYAPCMNVPVRRLIYDECLYSEKMQTRSVYRENLYAMCNCIADEMAHYTKQNAMLMLDRLLGQNPNLEDPLEAITTSHFYLGKHFDARRRCVDRYRGD